ncbi:MAG: hypothetical protein IKQ17_01045, partial [Kiritimatiellae bacterium]|nr:hypothetical protein [Kiritimatiellia bacterium]
MSWAVCVVSAKIPKSVPKGTQRFTSAFGTLFDRIGYNAISNEMFRNIVICRLFNPGSKLKTVD